MSKRSFVYSSIHIYRIIMNMLYAGKNRSRLYDVISIISPEVKSITELCFGDTYIAETCRKRNVDWKGYDLNPAFVRYAVDAGYNAIQENIFEVKTLPISDLCIMMSAFYHFHGHEEVILNKMLACAPQVILSEPIHNLSNSRGPLGFIARRVADAGSGKETFRFNEKSFLAVLEEYSVKLCFKYTIISKKRDIIVRLTNENN